MMSVVRGVDCQEGEGTLQHHSNTIRRTMPKRFATKARFEIIIITNVRPWRDHATWRRSRRRSHLIMWRGDGAHDITTLAGHRCSQ